MNLDNISSHVQDGVQAVDDHVEKTHDEATGSAPGQVGTPSFCVVYVAVRPVLLFVKGLLFVKPKWQALITALIAGLDATCNPAQTTGL